MAKSGRAAWGKVGAAQQARQGKWGGRGTAHPGRTAQVCRLASDVFNVGGSRSQVVGLHGAGKGVGDPTGVTQSRVTHRLTPPMMCKR